MAGLAGLLGGYGSDDDDEQQQEGPPLLAGILTAPSGSISPPAGQQQPQDSTDGHQQQQQASQPPLRIMDGPSTNPEPPPEGLSPPRARELDSGVGSEVEDGGLPAALYTLPPDLREPPPGEVDPILQANVDKYYTRQLQSGGSLMESMRQNRRWQNPKFLQKNVDYFHLSQYGTCLSADVWDPDSIPDEDKWASLQQQVEARKRRRGAEVKFQSAGQQLPPLAAGAAAAAAAAAAASAAAAAAAALASQPSMAGSGAPKVVSIDPRAAAAHAQALASSLAAGAAGKKSKWDK